VESNWVHSARRPRTGLFYLLRVIKRVENSVKWWFAWETEVLAENLPQWHFIDQKSHMICPGASPGRRGGKPATNRLSHDTAKTHLTWVSDKVEVKPFLTADSGFPKELWVNWIEPGLHSRQALNYLFVHLLYLTTFSVTEERTASCNWIVNNESKIMWPNWR
jgi:hypothetical protein